MSARLDVVIVSYNTRADLEACLTSVFAHAPDGLGHVFVVDNASTDGSQTLVTEAFPAATLIALERNVGFAAANNVALRRATAPLVLLLNSDTVVPKGALDVLMARLDATGATVAGPRLVDADGRPEVSFGRMLTPAGELLQQLRVRMAASGGPFARRSILRRLADERWVDWVTGACLIVRRQAAIDAGLLDERYFMYEEDVDFCAAIRAAGGRVLFTPRAEIVHRRGRSLEQAGPRRTSHYDRSHVLFYEKHAPGWAPLLRLWLRLRRRAIR
jgi:GT2 family glycosyltransferase